MSTTHERKPSKIRGVRIAFSLVLSLVWAVASPAFGQEGGPDAATETLPVADEPAAGEPAAGEPAAGIPASSVVHVRLESIIHPVAAQFLLETLDYADEIRAVALVIELDTPGGLLESTRQIYKAMMGARTPVVVFVAPSGAHAASAGFFLLMASDVAAMAPGTNTGAAHPVAGQGQDIEGHMGEKVEQDAAAVIRSLAARHGRNVEEAEAAVIRSLSFTAEEALEKKLIEIVAPDLRQLLLELDGRRVEKLGEAETVLATATAVLERREMRAFQRFLSILIHPQIAYMLMMLGVLGLYVEISNPGSVFPGVVGAIFLIVGLYSMSVLPISYAGVGLVLLAVLFFVAEIYTPTFGALTVGGVIALILGSVMLFKDADPAMRLGLELIIGTSGAVLAVVLLLLRKAMQVRRSPVRTGAEGLVGERGLARGDLDTEGKVFVHGELWRAAAESPVASGAEIEVVEVDGLKLRVRAVGEPSAT